MGEQEQLDFVDVIQGHHQLVQPGVEGIVKQVMQLVGSLMLLKMIRGNVGMVAMLIENAQHNNCFSVEMKMHLGKELSLP